MVYHQIHHNLNPQLMGTPEHSVIVLHCSEFCHDRLIITDIVPIVIIRRLVNRRQPYDINPQLLQIIQLSCNSIQISDSVPVAVTETSGVNLIYNTFLPPCFLHVCIPPDSL